MKAAIFNGPGKPISIETVEFPQAGSQDVLVRIARCGICGSDVARTGSEGLAYPLGRFGHEYAGEIVEVGSGVTHLRPGQRVTCVPATCCGKCPGCRSGNPVFCQAPKQTADGGTGHGGFAEYISLPAESALPIAHSLSFADGALVEPVACGLHALNLARMSSGATVLVLGAGAMAMAVVFWARRKGAARIIVASRSSHRRKTAMTAGADVFHSLTEDDPAQLAAVLADGADIVAECVGKEGMLEEAISRVRLFGTVISMGMCQHSARIVPVSCAFKEARIVFPVGYSLGELVETARAFDADRIHPEFMVSATIGLEALPAMLDRLREGRSDHLKVMVDPGGDDCHG